MAKPFTFADAALLASRVADSKPTIPILGCLTYRRDDSGAWSLQATDLDSWLTVTSGTLAPDHRTGVYQAKAFADACKAAGDDLPTMSTDSDPALPTLHAGAVTMRAHSPAGDLPAFPAPGPTLATVHSGDMLDSVRHCLPAVTDEDTRYSLNGARLSFADNRLEATDGHRLHTHPANMYALPGAVLPKAGFIVRRDVLVLLDSLSACARRHMSTTMQIGVTTDRISVTFGIGQMTVNLASRVVEGSFPNVSKVEPWGQDAWQDAGPFPGADFLDRLKSILPSARKSHNPMTRVTVNGQIDMAFSDKVNGAEIHPPPVALTGPGLTPEVTIGLNPLYLADAVANDASYTLRIKSDTAQIGIMSTDGKRRATIMPMRLN